MEKGKNTKDGNVVPMNQNNPVSVKEILEEQLKKFQRLNKLVNDRDLFLAKKEMLTTYLNTIESENKTDEMETNICKIVFRDSRSYKEDNLTVSNILIIRKFISYMFAEIDNKVEELEKQIVL